MAITSVEKLEKTQLAILERLAKLEETVKKMETVVGRLEFRSSL